MKKLFVFQFLILCSVIHIQAFGEHSCSLKQTVAMTNIEYCDYSFTKGENDWILGNSEELITPGNPLNVTLIREHTYCIGCIGSVDVTVSGGAPPYSFLWSNGATTEDLSGLCDGSYRLTVTDTNGDIETAYAGVVSLNTFCTGAQLIPVSCSQECSGMAIVSPSGGHTPYNILWSTGETTEIISGLCHGIYLVTVTDVYGCKSVTGVIYSNPDLSPTVSVVPTTFSGISTLGVIVEVSEVNNNRTDGSPITVRIPSDPRITFNWDPSLTQVAFTPVDNFIWNYTGNNGVVHTFEFDVSYGFLGNKTFAFGLFATYDPQNTAGQTTLTATIVPTSGGECTFTNNSDSETLVYFN